MVDKPKLAGILSNLRRYVRKLRELAAMPREQFLADSTKVDSAEHNFQIAIQCCIDAANHVIAAKRFRTPKDYRDSFDVLIEERVLPAESRQTFRQMVSFRNRLVHLYWQVDDELVYRFLQDNLEDFDAFARAIGKVE